ncbi:Zinc finger, RING/FYVE/PHD-type [Cordyceps fumosorosea ARSEF 2679]|uniref:Zinc finger, RING/FYVE/PHD-type n=1 Tax=Cordyceps fumosorosea (strain ARSEF 2679) TaxID=1081104 RepID=A0A167LRB7_CORFA|nr:Zinc finger, RING/FYVE/PHD-type [Cordyceps fumosorosea ARSEF 2679]OAA53406.1 Zinc finger, RING/FYVE/PHD-type [Cordyceps fumosorosea ARSEF 2679]
MSLASASPRRASLDSDVVLVSTSPLPPRARHRHRPQALQPPTTITTAAAAAMPPAFSSSPRHYAHASSSPRHHVHDNSPHLRTRNQSLSTPNDSLSNHQSQTMSSSRPRPRRASPSPDSSVSSSDFDISQTQFEATPSDSTDSSDDEYLEGETPSDDNMARPPTQSNSTRSSSPYSDYSSIDEDNLGNLHTTNAAIDVPDSPLQPLHAGPSANTTQATDFSLPETEHSTSSLFDQVQDQVQDQGSTETASTSFSEDMPRLRSTARGLFGPDRNHWRLGERGKPYIINLTGLPRSEVLPTESPVSVDRIPDEDLETIDLTKAQVAPEPELKKRVVDNRIKLATYQCPICMDNVTDLTVTHCGHLFCMDCLNHSMDVEVTKGKCPMCRSKIDTKPREAYSTKTKGYWPLELKLMTRSKKGKRKAEEIST